MARDPRPGAAAAILLLVVYGGIALTVDFPRTAIGIQSDEATYYMMGHSLAADGDLTYRRSDLTRVWKEFSSGPSGAATLAGVRVALGDPKRRAELDLGPDAVVVLLSTEAHADRL